MNYRFGFSVEGRELATGQMTSVCCRLEPGRDVQSIPIPSLIADRLEEAPE